MPNLYDRLPPKKCVDAPQSRVIYKPPVTLDDTRHFNTYREKSVALPKCGSVQSRLAQKRLLGNEEIVDQAHTILPSIGDLSPLYENRHLLPIDKQLKCVTLENYPVPKHAPTVEVMTDEAMIQNIEPERVESLDLTNFHPALEHSEQKNNENLQSPIITIKPNYNIEYETLDLEPNSRLTQIKIVIPPLELQIINQRYRENGHSSPIVQQPKCVTLENCPVPRHAPTVEAIANDATIQNFVPKRGASTCSHFHQTIEYSEQKNKLDVQSPINNINPNYNIEYGKPNLEQMEIKRDIHARLSRKRIPIPPLELQVINQRLNDDFFMEMDETALTCTEPVSTLELEPMDVYEKPDLCSRLKSKQQSMDLEIPMDKLMELDPWI